MATCLRAKAFSLFKFRKRSLPSFTVAAIITQLYRGHVLRACVYIYIRKHNILKDFMQACLERVLEDLLSLKWNPTLIRA